MAKKDVLVNGQNIIYHYLQKEVCVEEDEFSKALVTRLILDLSIWLPVEFYRNLPIMLPFVVRDASCRRKVDGAGDMWGHANECGFLRDDNSLIKGIVKPFEIAPTKKWVFNGNKLGNGFVASHIWRKLKGKKFLASTYYKTNSFVPNLVWLPAQISKLTDREGSYAQRVLQFISYKLYRDIVETSEINEVWALFEKPEIPIEIDVEKLNFFNVSINLMEKRKKQLMTEIALIHKSLETGSVQGKVKCSNYIPTLLDIDASAKKNLVSWLRNYEIQLTGLHS